MAQYTSFKGIAIYSSIFKHGRIQCKIFSFLSMYVSLFCQSPQIFCQDGDKDYSFSRDLVFNNLTEKDGLSNNVSTCMIADKEGYLWIGTLNGLNRFDGKHFQIFRRDKSDSSSLLQNSITSLALAPSGNIWIGTDDGISCYDKSLKKFVHYPYDDSNIYLRVHAMVCDDNGMVWTSSSSGIVRLDPFKKEFKYYKIDTSDIYGLPSYPFWPNSMAFDKKKKGLWITTNKGLCFLDFSTDKFKHVKNTAGHEIFNKNRCSSIHIGISGIVWYLDESTKEIVGIDPILEKKLHSFPMSGFLKNPFAGVIYETIDNQIWYSSSSYEIISIDYKKTKCFKKVWNDVRNPSSIAGDYAFSIMQDKDQSLWFTTTGGISRLQEEETFHRTLKPSKQYPEFLENWYITTLAQHPVTGTWWIGSRADKIYSYDPVCDIWQKIEMIQDEYSNIRKYITHIGFVDKLVIFCFAGCPPYQYDPRTNLVSRFNIFPEKYKDLKVRILIQETDSTYILGNFMPVLRWNKKQNTFTELRFNRYKNKNGIKFTSEWLSGMKDRGTWLAASNQDLGYLHPGDSIFYILDMPIGSNVRKGGTINSIKIDANGDPWMAFSSQGLYHIKKLKNKIEKESDIELLNWTNSDGLSNETLHGAIADHSGHIWCASLNNFSIYNVKEKEFSNFKIPYSENNGFYFNYLLTLHNGNVVTNILGDLIEFNPSMFKVIIPKNDINISSIKLQDRTILLFNDDKVDLEPHENFFSVNFGSISLANNTHYFFEYQLNGIDKTWVKAPDNCEAVYTNIEPGKYTFMVRIHAKDKTWQSEPKSIIINIQAPYYKTWWFTLLAYLSLSLLIFSIARWRINHLKNINSLKDKAQLLEKEKTTVMYENLKQHLNPHFLFNSLSSLSSLIRIDPKKALDFLDQISKVYRYILRNKDNETVSLDEEIKFVETYISLQKTRFEEGLNVAFSVPEDILHRRIVPVTLQNLIENAIKHNTADPESPLAIEIFNDENYLIVRNNLQKKSYVETSNKQGLQSMISLYKYLSPLPLTIQDQDGYYSVKIPLI